MPELSNKSLDIAIPFSNIVKMKNIVGKPATLTSIESLYPDADIIINTALFDMSDGDIISRVFAEGVKYGSTASWASTWGIAFGDEAGPRLSWDNGVNAPEFLGPFSSCVYDGKIGNGSTDKSKRGRTAIGLTKDSFVVVCTPDNSWDTMTTDTLCKAMLERGCTFAINLDGGGSSQFKSPNGRYSSGRKCPAWLAIWLKKDETVETPEQTAVKCVCKKKTYTLDSNGKKEGSRYIDKGDICTLGSITSNCLIRITYPTSKGNRTAFIKSLESFEPKA